MSFEFRRAERTTTSALIALAGASGSGKTYTAICLALGLAYPHMSPDEILATIEREGRCRVVVLDSEGGRALHYAPKPGQKPDFKDNFPFEYAELKAPFTPQSYQDAVVGANDAGFAAVVVDSASHEYESEGGLLEWADKLEAGVPKPGVANPEPWRKDDWIERPVKAPGQWKEPKRAHKIMVGRFLQCRCHLIFCLRAEEKMRLVQEKFTGNDGKERSSVKVIPAEDRPINERWEPICEKRFMYEMTASFVLLPNAPGVGIPLKLQEQHRAAFPEGQLINAQSGWRLADWASGAAGGTSSSATSSPDKASPGGDSAAERANWVDKYVANVGKAKNMSAVDDLKERYRDRLDAIREGYPELWQKIAAAHVEASNRFGEN